MPFPAEVIHLSINRPAADVYAYASRPENMAEWSAGLSKTRLVQEGEFWITDSPMGRVKIKFAPPNSVGVLDHDVILPDGSVMHNPLRVQKNDRGAEVIFTLYRLPGVSAEDFARDASLVKSDLEKLKKILESQSEGP